MNIHKICLTGGSCSGKTTSLVRIREHLEKLGWSVFVVPEAATIVFGGAGRPKDSTRKRLLEYQRAILLTQLHNETCFAQLANNPRTLLLTDRGTPDGKAFLTTAEWQALLGDLNLDDYRLLNSYDAVVHLVTAADGAPQAYRLEGVRNETPEEASAQDLKLQQAYLGHGHHKIIDNSTGFDEKVRRAVAEICRVLGEPEPLEIERKFKVSAPVEIPSGCVNSLIEQTYLESDGATEERVRKRTQNGSSLYTHGCKQPVCIGKRIEKERSLSGSEYLQLLETRRDGNRVTLHKRRHCFIHQRRVYELDEYLGYLSGLWILEAEVEDLDAPLTFPDWLQVSHEVTGDPAYSNAALALTNPHAAARVIA